MDLGVLDAASLLAALPEPAVVIDGEGGVIASNAAAALLLGTPPEGVSGSILQYLPEEERRRLNPLHWLKHWGEAQDAPELRHVHLLCRAADGREMPVRVRVGRLADIGYLVLLTDIAEEQARQQGARNAHRLAARVLALAADGILNVDEAMVIRYANASAEALFGYAPGTLTGQPLAQLLPSRFREDHVRSMREFARNPQPARLMGERGEVVGLTRDGLEIPLEATIAKITMDDTRMFSAHLRDLRPRKAARQALTEARATSRVIFEHALQAMALIGSDGVVKAMNPAARRLLRSDMDPIGERFAGLPFWSGDPGSTRSELEAAVERCLGGAAFRTEARIALPGGGTRTLDFSLTPVAEDGEVFAIIAEARDLTDRTA